MIVLRSKARKPWLLLSRTEPARLAQSSTAIPEDRQILGRAERLRRLTTKSTSRQPTTSCFVESRTLSTSASDGSPLRINARSPSAAIPAPNREGAALRIEPNASARVTQTGNANEVESTHPRYTEQIARISRCRRGRHQISRRCRPSREGRRPGTAHQARSCCGRRTRPWERRSG